MVNGNYDAEIPIAFYHLKFLVTSEIQKMQIMRMERLKQKEVTGVIR